MVTPRPAEDVWCYSEWQPLYQTLQVVTFIEGLPDVTTWEGDKKHLVIIDDLLKETDERVTALFTKGSHHRNFERYLYCSKSFW
jgi:hypothetical protein